MRKKIAAVLTTGLVMGAVFVTSVSIPIAEAAENGEKVLNIKSPAEVYADQGEKLFDEKKYEESAKAYEKAAKEAKTNDVYWWYCGHAYAWAGKFKAASDCYEKAVKINPNKGEYYKSCALSYINRYEQSQNDTARMFGFAPNSLWDLIEKADKYAMRAASMLPNDIATQRTAGYIAATMGNYLKSIRNPQRYIDESYQKAYNYYHKALELDPNNEESKTMMFEFVQAHPGYGSMPSMIEPSAPPSTPGTTEQPTLGGQNDVTQVVSPDEFQDINGDIAQYGHRKTNPNGIEFHPMGWPDDNGFVAVWKIPPDSYGGTHVIRMGEYRREGHGLYPIGFHFDYNPETEKFTVYYSTGSTTRSYLYYVTIIDPEAYIVEVEHLEPMDEEWDRKVENPAYQVASPVVCQASKYCPHPKEKYQLKILSKALLSRINETDGSINPDYPLFVSEYGISSFKEDGYPYYRGFLGQEYPLYEALIEYYKLYNEGGEVADYPQDAGALVMFGAS